MPFQYPKPIVQQPLENPSPNTYPFPAIPGLDKPIQPSNTPIEQQVTYGFSKPTATLTKPNQSVGSSTNYGVTRLSIVVINDDKTAIVSQSFNNGKGDGAKKGKYYDEVKSDQLFNFAPGVDKPKICWKVRNPSEFKKVTFELFCKGHPQAIWTETWENENIAKISTGAMTAGSKDKNGSTADIQWTGSLNWERSVRLDRTLKLKTTDPSPAFPDEILTVKHSPYQLKMTIEGKSDSKGSGYPLIAWTYIHVLVHSIELSWGRETLLSSSRSDVDPTYKSAVLGYEKIILQELQQKATQPGLNLTHEVRLTSNQFAHKAKGASDVAEYADKTDYQEYKKLWGDGPRIPLLAKVYIKTAKGTRTDKAPQALVGTRILWDWQDNAPVRWKQYTAEATYTTEDYLESLFRQQNPIAKPLGSSNCPSRFGGKLGNPALPVFPPQNGSNPFPYVVEGCQNRSWAALSNFGTTPTNLDTTGVIFQPSRMAGDRYEVSACLYFDEAIDSDQDIQVTPQAVHASAGKFEIFRRINVTYMVRGSNADLGCNPDDCIQNMKALYRQELGIVLDVNKVNVDNTIYRQAIVNAIETLIQTPIADQTIETMALMLRHLIDTQPPANSPGVCYVDYPEFLQRLEQTFKQGRLRYMQLPNAVGQLQRGEEIIGIRSGAKGVFLNFMDPTQTSGLVLLTNNNQDFLDLEQVRGRASKTIVGIVTFSSRSIWGYAIWTFADQSSQYKKTIDVNFTNYQNATSQQVTIDYAKKTFTRSLKTALTDQAQQDLKNAFLQMIQTLGEDVRIEIVVRGRQDSPHANERIKNIQAYLQTLFDDFVIIDRKATYQALISGTGGWKFANNLDEFQRGIGRNSVKLHDSLLPVITEEYSKLQYPNQPGILMLHIPGTNNNRTLAQGRGIYEMPPVEGAYFADSLTTQRDKGIFYLSTVDPKGQFVWQGASKTPLSVLNHELAHAIFKAHAPSTVIGAWVGQHDPGNTLYKAHVAKDNCLMNYDVNSEHFCGLCMVRSRGWEWDPTKVNEVEMEYQLTWEIGDINELFTYPASIERGKMERLQVLGLFNNPLNHVDATDCFPFAWNHALSLFPQLQAPGANLEVIFANLIKDFLISGGQLPTPGNFAKIRISGGHTLLYSSAFLEAKFTEEEQRKPESKKYSQYMLEESKRYLVEQNYYAANPSLGKIPLIARVRKRPKGSTLNWSNATLAPEAHVYFQLLPADPLPALPTQLPTPTAAKHSVAGGWSHYNQIAAPPLTATAQTYITTKVDQYKPSVTALGMSADPHRSNAHVDFGGKRGLSNKQDVFLQPRDQGGRALLPVPTENHQHKYAVRVVTDENGEAKVIFSPSCIGGDRYKIRAYVVTSTNDGTTPSDAVVETGTMVRWRTLRICRHVYMPHCPTVTDLPNDLKKRDLRSPGEIPISPNLNPYVGKALPDLDLAGKITQEFAKNYCELILEPAALQREPIANESQNILQQIATLVADYPDFNKPRRGISIFKEDLTVDSTDPSGLQFKTILKNKPEPNTLTIRVQNQGKETAIFSDEVSPTNPDGNPIVLDNTKVASGTIDDATGEVKIVFKAVPSIQYQVAYYPDAYIDTAAILPGFPAQSPFLFNLRLPQDYNTNKKPDFSDFEVNSDGSQPTSSDFIDARKLGLVKGLFMTAVSRGIGKNNGFYPGLVIIQAFSLDTYSAIWPRAIQEGKAVGGGVFLFANAGGDANRLALHEMSHGLYFHHAGTASGARLNLHDPTDTCVMTYDANGLSHCGQCVASLRGMNEWSKLLNDQNT